MPGAEDPLRPVALQELIKADLEIRWRRGLTARIESYVNDFPDLKVGGTLSPLIYEEYRVRQMHGDKPPVTAYKDRFPSEYEELQRLVQEQPLPTVNQTDTPEARQEGLTTYLLAEALRQYQLAGYGQFEAQAAATDISLRAIFVELGMNEYDEGVLWAKR